MIIRVQIAGQELNPINLIPYIKGEKGDKGDPANSISSDPQNAARLGSDGKIFVPSNSVNPVLNIDEIDAALGQKLGDLAALVGNIVQPFQPRQKL